MVLKHCTHRQASYIEVNQPLTYGIYHSFLKKPGNINLMDICQPLSPCIPVSYKGNKSAIYSMCYMHISYLFIKCVNRKYEVLPQFYHNILLPPAHPTLH